MKSKRESEGKVNAILLLGILSKTCLTKSEDYNYRDRLQCLRNRQFKTCLTSLLGDRALEIGTKYNLNSSLKRPKIIVLWESAHKNLLIRKVNPALLLLAICPMKMSLFQRVLSPRKRALLTVKNWTKWRKCKMWISQEGFHLPLRGSLMLPVLMLKDLVREAADPCSLSPPVKWTLMKMRGQGGNRVATHLGWWRRESLKKIKRWTTL